MHPQEQTGLEGSYQKPQPETEETKGNFEAHEFKTKERGEGPRVELLQLPKSVLFLQLSSPVSLCLSYLHTFGLHSFWVYLKFYREAGDVWGCGNTPLLP